MSYRFIALLACLFVGAFSPGRLFATVDGALSGTVLDDKGIAVPDAKVTITGNGVEKDLTTSATGTYQVFPLTLGEYQVSVQADGFNPYTGKVALSGNSTLDIQLVPSTGNEMQMTVTAKRHLVTAAPASSRDLDSSDIEQLPEGATTSLPRLLYTTTAGFVEGDFGQVFTRGNHANLQYQIDGIQLPDSVGGSFGEAFTPVNIDHMEILTGGLQPEFGNRMAGVVNIVTKSGSTEPGGEIGLDYGSYNQTSSFANYGGADASGAFHYFLSANAFSTDRGLDTPAPADINNDQNGGSEQAIHDKSYGSDGFLKLDYVADNADKLVLIAFSENKFYQIPDYDSSFDPGGSNFAYFQGLTDVYMNGPFNYVPSSTNDTQSEANKYVEFSWKHTFDENSFIQISPYWKESNLIFTNDPANDLAAANNNALAALLGGITESSFSENRTSENYGGQVDYTWHADSDNLIKVGGQFLLTQSSGPVSVIEATNPGDGSGVSQIASSDDSSDTGYQEGLYVQDELTLAKGMVLSGGVRFDAIQFVFSDTTSNDSLVEPRIGLSLLPTDTTKVHFFYGKLFMPAPPEDLRDTFSAFSGGTTLAPYDIKAEKDDYFEAGVDQQVGNQLFTLTGYYKSAVDMLDETQLLNTAIAQPYNFSTGYAYGVEFATRGKLDKDWSDFANYSYEIAEGEGINGGLFAFDPADAQAQETAGYQFLDHCQIHTANGGFTYNPGDVWLTAEGLFGGGLSTGPGNSLRLPSHFTADLTLGYAFKKDSGLSGMKASVDVLNVFDNPYTIFIDNGYNGNHYENGREFIFHLDKEI